MRSVRTSNSTGISVIPKADHPVRAAGGVVHSDYGDVLVVHRPHLDDWTFPKGKLEAGESDEIAALREVEEETGYHCALGQYLGSVMYPLGNGRTKVVRWWAMTVLWGHPTSNEEVDDIRWMDAKAAAMTLSYDTDRDVLGRFCTLAQGKRPPAEGVRP